jgi:hypothetical protein
MDMTFFNRISKSNASTDCRNGNRDFVLQNPESLIGLIAFATDLTNKNQYKAVWIIEMLAETHTELLIPFIDIICKTIPHYKHESSIRGMSRTAFFLSTSKAISLSEEQQEKLIEICLDWLIGDAKIAPKVYAMYTLGHYAKKHDWVKEELHNIINKDYAQQSAGYKAAAREVLRKI